MLFDPVHRQLYFFAGLRFNDYLADMYRYDIDRDELVEICQDTSKTVCLTVITSETAYF